jgi:hypothetical protein
MLDLQLIIKKYYLKKGQRHAAPHSDGEIQRRRIKTAAVSRA